MLRTFAGIAISTQGNFDPYVMGKNKVLVQNRFPLELTVIPTNSGIAIWHLRVSTEYLTFKQPGHEINICANKYLRPEMIVFSLMDQ